MAKTGKRKVGRPPKNNGEAMSPAERQRQYRARLRKAAGVDGLAQARRTLEFLLSSTRRLRTALEAGDPGGVRLAFMGVENNVRLMHFDLGVDVPEDIGGRWVKMPEPPAAPSPLLSTDLEALQAILAYGRSKIGVMDMQLELLHGAFSPDTRPEVTGPAWQLRFSLADWKGTIDYVSAVLEGRGAEVPRHWRTGKPAPKRKRSAVMRSDSP